MKKALYVLIPLAIALAIRLYPAAISGMPFSTDAWPLIRNAELLAQNTPVPLTSGIFDGYNNYWPANQVFGVVLSQITGLPVITAMSLGIPIVATLSIPIFYLLVKKLTENTKIALIATILLATAFPYALFTAGVTKETFASPLYLLVILLFLLKRDWKTTALFSVASFALLLSHHFTAFLAIVIISGLSAASFITKKNNGEEVNSNRSNLLLLVILSIMTAMYFLLYALPALIIAVTASELLSVAAYQIFIVAIAMYVILKPSKQSKWRNMGRISLGLLLVSAFILLVVATPALQSVGAPDMPMRYLLYMLPFMIAVPTAIAALGELHKKHPSIVLPFFWLLSIVAFSCFAVLGNPPGGVGFAYRSLNFILPPLVILVALGTYKLYTSPKRVNTRRLTKVIAVLVVLSMATVGTYSVYATVELQEPYLGYFWRYEPSEYQAGNWMSTNAHNETVAGDFKVYYLVNGYFNETVAILDGLRYLEGNGSAPKMLYIYNQMYRNGYVLYQGSPVTLPANWTDKLSGYNCIYSNPEVTIYAKR